MNENLNSEKSTTKEESSFEIQKIQLIKFALSAKKMKIEIALLAAKNKSIE